MHDQVRRDDDCSDVAGQILAIRVEMARPLRQPTILGNREPISVSFGPRRPVPLTAFSRTAKRREKRRRRAGQCARLGLD